MNKQEFITALGERLSGLPPRELEDRLSFYGEMIDDRVEEGLSEAVAVAAIGDLEDVVARIVAETPLLKIVTDRVKPKRRLHTWEIVLLIAGFPVWLLLLISAFTVALALYVSFWSVVVSLWAFFASLAACALCGVGVGIGFCATSHLPAGLAVLGAGLASAGLAILLFFGCKVLTKGLLLLLKKAALGMKLCFIGKEGRNA